MKKILKNTLNRFYREEKGVVALIVALTLVLVLFGVLSLSIGLNQTQTSYTHNYNATDAAALSGAEMWLNGKINAIGETENPLDFRPSEDVLRDYVKESFKTNFNQDQSNSEFMDTDDLFTVTMDEETTLAGRILYTVKVDACATLDLDISRAAGHQQDGETPETARTCTSSTAGFELGTLQNTEVAFALDFTESMYWSGQNQACPPSDPTQDDCPSFGETKAASLQSAMDYVLDKYFDDSEEATAFASIVPYTSFVNVYPFNNRGVVSQEDDPIDLDGLQFSDFSGNEAPADNAWSKFYPLGITKTTGSGDDTSQDLKTYIKDLDYTATNNTYTPFFLNDDQDDNNFYDTRNYSPLLNRIPTLSSSKLSDVTSNPRNRSFLPFDNYHNLVNYIAEEDFISDHSISPATNQVSADDAEDQFAKMVCYQYTIAAAADERAPLEVGDDGILRPSVVGSLFNGGRRDADNRITNDGKGLELHESFPVQPLTNDITVLNNVLERYTATTLLNTGNSRPEDEIVDFQAERIDKARIMSVYHKTSSIHGLMWAWFTINNEWQDVWNANSLHETYVGGDKSSRDGTGGAEQLPSSENFKHIILISDGYDNDGCEDRSGGTGSAEVGVGQGRLNVCDAYQPVEAVTDTEYTDLCTAIKTNGTSTANDDITIHTITFDFDVNFGAVSDGVCDKAGGVDNRFAQCATPGNFYNNKNPDELRDVFDDIFSGILTDGAAVRLIK